MEVEGLWPPNSWSNVTHGCNECSIPGHISKRFPGMDQACQNCLSSVYCPWWHTMWFGWDLWPNAVHRFGYSFLSIAKMHCSILKPHFQNCSHIQRYRSLCGPNCESFCISFRQNACNDHIFQNPQTLLSFTLYNSQNTFEHIIQMLINCFQNW